MPMLSAPLLFIITHAAVDLDYMVLLQPKVLSVSIVIDSTKVKNLLQLSLIQFHVLWIDHEELSINFWCEPLMVKLQLPSIKRETVKMALELALKEHS